MAPLEDLDFYDEEIEGVADAIDAANASKEGVENDAEIDAD